MSSKKNHPLVRRMNQLHIPTFQIAHHVMLSTKDVDDWVDGKKRLPSDRIWGICELLDIDFNEVLVWELDNA
jgi:hypothetical protein